MAGRDAHRSAGKSTTVRKASATVRESASVEAAAAHVTAAAVTTAAVTTTAAMAMTIDGERNQQEKTDCCQPREDAAGQGKMIQDS